MVIPTSVIIRWFRVFADNDFPDHLFNPQSLGPNKRMNDDNIDKRFHSVKLGGSNNIMVKCQEME